MLARLLCLLLGHRPIDRTASSKSVVHHWTACGRCWTVLSPSSRHAIANRRLRRRIDKAIGAELDLR